MTSNKALKNLRCSQILCVVHVRAQTFRTTCDIEMGLAGKVGVAGVTETGRCMVMF